MKKRIRLSRPTRRLYASTIALILLAFISNASSQTSPPTTPAFLGPQVSVISNVKTGAFAKVGGGLARLYSEHATYLQQQQGGFRVSGKFASTDPIVKLVDSSVVIDAVATDDAADLLADLKALGLTNGVSFGRMVSGRLPIAKIEVMAALSSLHFARPAAMKTNAGITTSQGDQAMRADIARTAIGVTGVGVIVGVLSDSFNCLGSGPADDLPAGVNILEDFCPGGTDEGRALMQIVHDVAPGAAGAFHSAFNGKANFAQGIIDLQQAGARVIVDDAIYFDEPMFQDSIIAQAVDTVKARGVAYFSAAGNSARKSYQSNYRPSGIAGIGGIGILHDFDPGPGVNTFQSITLPTGPNIASFQWDEPYFSVSGAPGSTSDYDIYICILPSVDNCLPGSIVGGVDPNLGGDPIEVIGAVYDGSLGPTVSVYLAIVKITGPANSLLKYVGFSPQNKLTINTFNTQSGSIFGHANAAGAETVGAAFYFNVPEFGTSPPLLETFSSAGGTPILFDSAGIRHLTPIVRKKPEIVAPDGTNNTVIGFDIPDPGDGSDTDIFPNLFGTSAAAPHAAAVAALMLDESLGSPTLLPDEIYSTLERTATDMKAVGFDFNSGFGLIQADAAVTGGIPVQFSSATYRVSEAVLAATITVTRAGGTASPASVNFSTSDGTASAGTDYTAVSGTLTFGAGETSKTFTIPIINDTLHESNKRVNLALSSPTGGVLLGARATAVLVVVDNDPAGTVQFSSATFRVNEAGPTATITVTRTGGTASGVGIGYTMSDGTATTGTDYTAMSGTLTFGTGETSKTFTIPIINDTLQEPNQRVNLALSNPTGGALLGVQVTAVMIIVDNDPAGTVQFSTATYSINEPRPAATITVTRTGGTASGVTVDYTMSNGTATTGADYTALVGTLTFGAGEISKTFTVPILDDQLVEGNETVSLELINPTGGATFGIQRNSILTIRDNEVGLQFIASRFRVSEAGSIATITVTRIGQVSSTVTVAYATSDDTAIASTDYTAVSGTLTFGAGEISRTFTIPIINDSLDEPNERVNIALSNPTGGALLGAQATAFLIIVDNDLAGTVQFSVATFRVNEAVSTAMITVTRTGGVASGVGVDYTVSDGTATTGADYTAVSGTLIFGAGETSKTFTIPIINDALDEPNERVSIALSNPTGGALLDAQATSVLIIIDNDLVGTM
ncbi:MAG: S8 family serine peptidase [Methylococcaceae bacterium]|nr:S8 family serine peptidase [Methylococcaceae bacterium]